MPQIPDFGGRPLNAWTRGELESLFARQRKESPKIRQVLDWMDGNGVADLSTIEEDVLFSLARDLGLPVFASTTEALLRKNRAVEKEAAEDQAGDPDGDEGSPAGEPEPEAGDAPQVEQRRDGDAGAPG